MRLLVLKSDAPSFRAGEEFRAFDRFNQRAREAVAPARNGDSRFTVQFRLVLEGHRFLGEMVLVHPGHNQGRWPDVVQHVLDACHVLAGQVWTAEEPQVREQASAAGVFVALVVVQRLRENGKKLNVVQKEVEDQQVKYDIETHRGRAPQLGGNHATRT